MQPWRPIPFSNLSCSSQGSHFKLKSSESVHKTFWEIIWHFSLSAYSLRGCGMGPWLILVFPEVRENIVATCKIGSFLCSLDNLLQKNIIVLFFGNQISKWRSFENYFDLHFTFFSHQGKVTKIPSAHISLTYIHVFCSPYRLFALPILKKKYEFIRYGFALVWVLVLILIRAILESINNKTVSKIEVGMSTLQKQVLIY